MNILLTNDDGFDAPGLRAAYDAIAALGSVFVVAPEAEQSACSHRITLGEAVVVTRRVHERFGPCFCVRGTPADCVRLGVVELIDAKIDLVVSGINQGANAGVDTYYSGTIAAAREGAILRIASIALSQALRHEVALDWDAARDAARAIVPSLIAEPLSGLGFWSVNLPAPIPDDPLGHVRRVPVAIDPMPMKFQRTESDDGGTLEFRYGASYWSRDVKGDSDFATICKGDIAVSAIPLFPRLANND